MVNITQGELEQLVCQNTSRIRKAKQRVVGEHSPQSHRPRMQNSLMAQTTQTRMSMHNLNLFPQHNVPKDREEAKHCWKGRGSIDDQKWDMIDLDAVCEVADAGSSFVCVCDDYDFVPAVYEFSGELIDM